MQLFSQILNTTLQAILIGYYELPVTSLVEPAPARLLRNVDELFIKAQRGYDIESIYRYSTNCGAGDAGKEFQESKLFTYHYDMIGGKLSS